jgi:DNA repair photolyase
MLHSKGKQVVTSTNHDLYGEEKNTLQHSFVKVKLKKKNLIFLKTRVNLRFQMISYFITTNGNHSVFSTTTITTLIAYITLDFRLWFGKKKIKKKEF